MNVLYLMPKILMMISIKQGVCTESGMYALRERRVHVTQEDFEMAVAKVYFYYSALVYSIFLSFLSLLFVNLV